MDSINTMLVSVYVVTYNSAEYVIETLNSVYNQTYNNIELIITDDASTDNTIELCKRWLNNHQDRFSDVQLVTSTINTGISANCNRAVKVAKGYWLKGIAGDDILLPNCVKSADAVISGLTPSPDPETPCPLSGMSAVWPLPAYAAASGISAPETSLAPAGSPAYNSMDRDMILYNNV